MGLSERRLDRLLCLALVVIVGLLFATGAPTGGAFSWPDSPRHALNGAFVLDLLRAMPIGDPRSWAYEYYAQYPALTILLYPPLYPAILAPFYALFGVSQETALFVNFLFYAALACGAYRLARFHVGPGVAFGVALILTGAPEVAYWGRQVMTEIPAFALLVWSAVGFRRHIENDRRWPLACALLLLLAAIYVKISVVFAIPVFAVLLLRERGWDALRRREYWIAAAIVVAALLPLIWLTLHFGQANLESVEGIDDSQVSRSSIAGWLWYARQFPGQLGWPALAASIAGLVLAAARWRRIDRTTLWLFAGWLGFGYLFFSAIDLKEARHSIFLLLPLALAAGYACRRLLPTVRSQASAAIALGIVTLGITVTQRPVHYVDGYSKVVAYVAEHAPRDTNVLFSGYRDGSFIFGMRAEGDRPDLNTLRADKLLLRIAVRRELGVGQTDYSDREIVDLLTDNSVSLVVAQPDFWTDLDQMARLQRVLRSNLYEEVARFPMHANYPAQETELIVYRNRADLPGRRAPLEIGLPIIDRTIETD